MALKLSVESIDDVNENLRPLYTEKDGKYVLQVDGLDDITQEAVSAATRRANKEAIEERKKRQAWERIGKSPEEIQALLDAEGQRATTEAERRGEWDKLKEQMNNAHRSELAKKDETLAALRRRLNTELVDKTAVSEIAAASGVPDLLLPHVQRFTKVDDDFNVVVVDAKGDPRVKGNGDPFTIKDLVAEMRSSEIFGRAFNGTGHSGGGTPPGNGGGGTPQIKTKADIYKGLGANPTPAQMRKARADFVTAHGPAAYNALPG